MVFFLLCGFWYLKAEFSTGKLCIPSVVTVVISEAWPVLSSADCSTSIQGTLGGPDTKLLYSNRTRTEP